MPSWLRIIVAALATWRLAQFVVLDDGPWDVMYMLRRLLGRYDLVASQEDPRVQVPATGIGKLLECVHCVGKWTALLSAGLALWPTALGDLWLLAWGLAGAQSLLEGPRDAHGEVVRVRRMLRRRGDGS